MYPEYQPLTLGDVLTALALVIGAAALAWLMQ